MSNSAKTLQKVLVLLQVYAEDFVTVIDAYPVTYELE